MALGTFVQIQISSLESSDSVQEAMLRAIEAMRAVEQACSRFDEDSELSRLVRAPIGTSVYVSPILFQSLQFACEVAAWTEGRFDPTIASEMEALGFINHYLTGEEIQISTVADDQATFRDIELDPDAQTICLHRPLHLDLGAVAKGLAVDLAVRELASYPFQGFVVDAGGDIYAAGTGADGDPWKVDIRDPIHRDRSVRSLQIRDAAVCTSGTYERRSPRDEASHHIMNAHDKRSAQGFISLTAVGSFTMMTDAFSTAAFLYAKDDALALLQEVGLEAMVITEDLQIDSTSGMEGYFNE